MNNIQRTAAQVPNLAEIAGGSPAAAVRRAAEGPKPQRTAGNDVLGTPVDKANLSRPGQIYGKLEELKAQDPAKYKDLVSKTAAHVQRAADDATGHEQTFLNGLAAKFAKAADGDLTALKPPSQNLDPRVAAYAKQRRTGPPEHLLMRHANGGPDMTNGHNKALDDAIGSLTEALGLGTVFDGPSKTAA
ncbi:MAG: hypothetical protein JST30_00055 [Armatimonadetes bacterium]|nr:hypothetical protein [Armatimonadota bacterium]